MTDQFIYIFENEIGGEAPENPEAAIPEAVDAAYEQLYNPWFAYFLLYDPGAYWQQVTVPVLALFGDLDVQVDVNQNMPAMQTALETAGNADVTFISFPTANHLFQEADSGSPDEYGTLEQTFIPDFLPTITDWLLERVDVVE